MRRFSSTRRPANPSRGCAGSAARGWPCSVADQHQADERQAGPLDADRRAAQQPRGDQPAPAALASAQPAPKCAEAEQQDEGVDQAEARQHQQAVVEHGQRAHHEGGPARQAQFERDADQYQRQQRAGQARRHAQHEIRGVGKREVDAGEREARIEPGEPGGGVEDQLAQRRVQVEEVLAPQVREPEAREVDLVEHHGGRVRVPGEVKHRRKREQRDERPGARRRAFVPMARRIGVMRHRWLAGQKPWIFLLCVPPAS
jgi:hypothetical protein